MAVPARNGPIRRVLRPLLWFWLMMRLATVVGLGRMESVERIAKKLLELDPEDSLALEYLARARAARKRR